LKLDMSIELRPESNNLFDKIYIADVAAVTAFLLRRQRVKHGLTLVEVTRRLGAKSLNSYARYEQGKAVPTMEKFSHLLSALSPCNDFVLTESRRT